MTKYTMLILVFSCLSLSFFSIREGGKTLQCWRLFKIFHGYRLVSERDNWELILAGLAKTVLVLSAEQTGILDHPPQQKAVGQILGREEQPSSSA